jgi:hypothetical protein
MNDTPFTMEFSNVTVRVSTDSDLLDQYRSGEIDFETLGPSWAFQHAVHKYGTLEEKRRLNALNVGYCFDPQTGEAEWS